MAASRSALVAVFDNQTAAERAIDALKNAGFRNEQIHYSGQAASGGFFSELKSLFVGEEHSADNVAKDMVNLGVPENEARYYANEYQTGHPIVVAKPNGREMEAANILRSAGASSYNPRAGTAPPAGTPRVDTPPSSGTRAGTSAQTGFDQPAQPRVDRPGSREASSTSSSIPLREERLQAEKEQVQKGEVRIHKEVVSEQKTINVPVSREEVVIEHHPVSGDRPSDTPIGQDETIRIPIREEQVHITKEPVVTDEISIEKRIIHDQEQFTDTVRREEAYVEPSNQEISQQLRDQQLREQQLRERQTRDRQARDRNASNRPRRDDPNPGSNPPLP